MPCEGSCACAMQTWYCQVDPLAAIELLRLADDVLVQALKHLRAQNPIYPQFQPMQLYEKIAVRRCQIPHCGRSVTCPFFLLSQNFDIRLCMYQLNTTSGHKSATGMPRFCSEEKCMPCTSLTNVP